MSEHTSLIERLAPHPPKPPVASGSKAGRNLKLAIPVAIGLLGAVAVSVLWRVEVFACLVALALTLGIWEATGAFLNKAKRIAFIPVVVAMLAMVACTWFWGLGATVVAFAVGSICVAAWSWLRSGSAPWIDDAAASVLVLGWIGGLGSFAVALAAMERPAWMVALLVLMPAASDTGGYAFGVVWGKHPMSPTISPKKSWEGFAGSLVLATLVAFLLGGLGLGLSWYAWLAIGVCAVVCATIGDLSESLIKRDLGVKDMGAIFPGHGGMLDRIDSILMWAPVCYMIMTSPLAR